MRRQQVRPEFIQAQESARDAPKGVRKVELALRRARAEGVLLLADCGLTCVPAAAFDLLSTTETGELSLNCCSTGELTKLDVSHNTLTELSADAPWEAFASLTTLRAHDNQLAASIDDTLCRIVSLVNLDLSSNLLAGELACSGLAALSRLRELDVSRNALSGLGPNLPPSLEVLRASHNRLVALPPAISVCTALRALDVSHNELRRVELSLASLVHLELSHNRLGAAGGACLVSGCAQLELLDVRDNELSALPALPRASRLVRLFAGFNRIESLDSVRQAPFAGDVAEGGPTAAATAGSGREDASHLLPLHACLGSALAELHLNDNRLSVLPSALVSPLIGLKVLALGNNRLADLPHELGYLPALTHIPLDGNPLRQVGTACHARPRVRSTCRHARHLALSRPQPHALPLRSAWRALLASPLSRAHTPTHTPSGSAPDTRPADPQAALGVVPGAQKVPAHARPAAIGAWRPAGLRLPPSRRRGRRRVRGRKGREDGCGRGPYRRARL